MRRRRFLLGVAGAAAAPALASEVAGNGATIAKNREQSTEGFNPRIEACRQAALDVLKPSRRDLEHGLELHAASLVFESYGFSPRAARDENAYAEVAATGASPSELSDLAEEMTMTRMVADARQREEYLQAWRASGVTCIFQNAGEESQAPLRIMKRLARFTYVTDMLGQYVARATKPDDIVAAKQSGRHALYFSSNGVPLAQAWENAATELEYIRLFFQLGVRMMHITYNRRNMLGDGCGETTDAGLSDFGRACVAEMNRVGVIPDVAHSGQATSYDTAQVSRRPAVASHSVCDAVNHHIRAKTDRVIKALCDTGGYIGIAAIPSFVGGRGDLSAMLDHIEYAVKRFGAEHVAIGTDVAYSAAAEKKPETPRVVSSRRRPRWEYLWPADAFPLSDDQPSLAWTNWPMFTVGMVQRGLTDDQIQQILGLNALRVARAALDGPG